MKCEYDLAGLAEEARCPECGHAVAHSRKVWAAGLPAGRSLVLMRQGLVTAVVGFGLLAATYALLWLVRLAWSERSELYWMVNFGPEVSRIPLAVGLWLCARAYRGRARSDHPWRVILMWGAVAIFALEVPLIAIRFMWHEAVGAGAVIGITTDGLSIIWACLGVVTALVWPVLLVASMWLMRRLGKTLPDREIALAAGVLMVAAFVTEAIVSAEFVAYLLFSRSWNLELIRLTLLPLHVCCTLLTLRVAQQLAAVHKTGQPRQIRWIRDGWDSLRTLAWKMRIDEQEPPPAGR